MKKRIIMLLLFVIIIGMLVGCEKETSKLEDEFESNVILMDKEIKEYIEKAKSEKLDTDKSRELYNRTVLAPIFGTENVSQEYLDKNNFPSYIIGYEELENLVDVLAEEDAVGIVEKALKKSKEYFPLDEEVKVYILPSKDRSQWDIEYDTGINASTSLQDQNRAIIISINPIIGEWKSKIPRTVAHEYHHMVWGSRNFVSEEQKGKKWALIDWLICEGKADVFADIIYPDIEASYLSSLYYQYYWTELGYDEKQIWNKIKPYLNNTDYDYYSKVMFGDYLEFPRNAGYKIGYNIMQGFIKNNPDVSIEDWTSMDAKEILEKSGYEERFQNSN
ncbi:DUF2268 domain-containing protein [Tissierella sp. MSJ-40]|uniref:DUF2268 domain-containing protein n=1 Tax=Tissierella simiarum TaxID=2841534 RepID=A0ABS6E3B3_9FIRM|nr:DUF2268 domain-containing putative Zn-dependent protease [Tissierella simiarum]MBU5437400.1 DUF2268 domain-containing protein [Tissierella simiarum]